MSSKLTEKSEVSPTIPQASSVPLSGDTSTKPQAHDPLPVPTLALPIVAQDSQMSLGFNASVTDLFPAEKVKEEPVNLNGPHVELRAETPPQKLTSKALVQQQLRDAISHFNLEDTNDNITAKFDAGTHSNIQDSQQLPPDFGAQQTQPAGRNFFQTQSKELIQFSFKTSDCFDIKEYDHLLKLVSKYDDSEARKQASRLKVAPQNQTKKTDTASPKNSTYNLSTQRTRMSEQSSSGRKTEMGESEGVKPAPLKSMQKLDRGFFALRSKHKLPLPGIIGSQQRNPAYTGAERQFRKKLKDLVSDIGQEIKDMHQNFREQQSRKMRGSLSAMKPRPNRELSPVRIRQLRDSLHQEIINNRHQKTKSMFIERALQQEEEINMREKRAYEAKRTMKPTPKDEAAMSQTQPVTASSRRKDSKLPNIKANMMSPHLVKIYREEQMVARNKEKILDIIKQHQFSTRELHQESSKLALTQNSSVMLQSIASSFTEETGPQFRVHMNAITNEVMLNRLAPGSTFAHTMPLNTSIQESLIMDDSSEEEKEKTPIPKHITPAGASIHKGASPTQFSSLDSKVTSNDEAYGVTANNPIRKIARDITALNQQVIMPGVNGKWVAHTLRVLTKRPVFTGECDERINFVDPTWAASYTQKKKKQRMLAKAGGREDSDETSELSDDEALVNCFNTHWQELRTGKIVEVIFNEKASVGGVPSAREGATLGFARNKAFIFGGFSQDRFNDTRAVDPEFGKCDLTKGAKEWAWEYIDCDIFVPMQRFGHSMVSFCDKLFVFGGGGGYKSALKYRETYGDLNIFLPQEKQWERGIKPSGKVAPSNRSNHAACEIGGVMIMYGGYWGEEK